jgi:hypothetical protein
MKYMTTYSLPSAMFRERVKRFLETGGLSPRGSHPALTAAFLAR